MSHGAFPRHRSSRSLSKTGERTGTELDPVADGLWMDLITEREPWATFGTVNGHRSTLNCRSVKNIYNVFKFISVIQWWHEDQPPSQQLTALDLQRAWNLLTFISVHLSGFYNNTWLQTKDTCCHLLLRFRNDSGHHGDERMCEGLRCRVDARRPKCWTDFYSQHHLLHCLFYDFTLLLPWDLFLLFSTSRAEFSNMIREPDILITSQRQILRNKSSLSRWEEMPANANGISGIRCEVTWSDMLTLPVKRFDDLYDPFFFFFFLISPRQKYIYII